MGPRLSDSTLTPAGHFAGDILVDDEPIVAVIELEQSSLRSASTDLGCSQESFSVGRTLASELCDPELRGVLVLSDGIACNGIALVDGLLSVLPGDTVVFGGLAADGDAFDTTTVLDRCGAGPGRVVAAGCTFMQGDLFARPTPADDTALRRLLVPQHTG